MFDLLLRIVIKLQGSDVAYCLTVFVMGGPTCLVFDISFEFMPSEHKCGVSVSIFWEPVI